MRWQGHGDAPVKKLYVQPGDSLGSDPSRYISMLPTVHNLNSFGYDVGVFGNDHREQGELGVAAGPARQGQDRAG